MGLFGGGGTPKYLRKAGKKIMDTAFDEYNSQSFTPYSGTNIAPMNDQLSTAINRAGAAGNVGQGAFNDALSTAKQGSMFTPSQAQTQAVAPTTVGSAAPMTAAQQGYVGNIGARDAYAGSMMNTNIDEYMNPYLRSVIDASMTDLNRNREVQRTADKFAGAGAGAFTNDSRMQIQNAETTGAYDRTAANTIADLYRSGYDTATGLATQDLDRAYTADAANVGRSLLADTTNQGLAQGVEAANAGYAQDTGLANMTTQQGQMDLQAQIDSAMAIADANNFTEAQKLNIMAEIEANAQRLQGAGLMGEVGAAQSSAAQSGALLGMQAGAVQQDYDQLMPSFEYNEFMRKINEPYKRMGLLTGSINSIGGQSKPGSVMGDVAGVLGGAGKLISAVKE